MATHVTFEAVSPCKGDLCFQFDNGDNFTVTSFNKGIMVIEPMCGCTIYSLAKNVSGCFKKGSNFYGLKAIEFVFNGTHISITAENADPDKIVKLWKEKRINRQE